MKNGLGLGLDEKIWIFLRPWSMIIQTTLWVIHISLPTVVASYLAFIQLIRDGTEAGIPWYLVRDNKRFACLKILLESVFIHHAHQHQSNEFSAMKVCFSDLTEQGCPTSCCAIWCLPSATKTISDICVTFVAIASITANAQLDAAIAVQEAQLSLRDRATRACQLKSGKVLHKCRRLVFEKLWN